MEHMYARHEYMVYDNNNNSKINTWKNTLMSSSPNTQTHTLAVNTHIDIVNTRHSTECNAQPLEKMTVETFTAHHNIPSKHSSLLLAMRSRNEEEMRGCALDRDPSCAIISGNNVYRRRCQRPVSAFP